MLTQVRSLFPIYIVVRSDTGASVSYHKTKVSANRLINREIKYNSYFDNDDSFLFIERSWCGKIKLC